MLATYRLLTRNTVIRSSAIAIFLFGFSGAATSPYMSLIGIGELGLSNAHYSILMLAAAFINVSASVAGGIVADRLGDPRRPMLAASLFGVAGFAMVYLFPSAAVFVVASLLFIPIFGTVNALIFANVRGVSSGMTASELMAVNSAIRAVLSMSWILVPGLVGAVLAGRESMLPAFLIAAFACLGLVLLFATSLPTRRPKPLEQGVEYAFVASLRLIAKPEVALRLLAIALISSMLHVNGAVLPLLVTSKVGGSATDVGIVVGIVAGLEVVFILFWGWVEVRTSTVQSILFGSLVYCVYLFLLGLADSPADVYYLTLVSGLGAAAIIAVPITYLQNLIADRAGLGSSLIAVNVFLGGGLSSFLFAIGTAVSDYAGTVHLAAGAGLAGILLLLALDGYRRQRQ